jgi:hypothetical protein
VYRAVVPIEPPNRATARQFPANTIQISPSFTSTRVVSRLDVASKSWTPLQVDFSGWVGEERKIKNRTLPLGLLRFVGHHRSILRRELRGLKPRSSSVLERAESDL